MIFDVVTYNGEKDLFDLRYNILKDFVDEFIVVEFNKTFSGKDKPPLFLRDFPELPDKVNYTCYTENHYGQYQQLAESSPNTIGAEHWKREFMQKESIKDALVHLKDDDIVFIGDCDEIWQPALYLVEEPYKIELAVYTYWLNNRSSEKFWGTMVSQYKDLKNQCLNHLRTDSLRELSGTAGWHFTSMANSLEEKLKDSYTEEDYANPEVMKNLQDNIRNNRDFLGRDFSYEVDESQWPEYLKNNREKYAHLIK